MPNTKKNVAIGVAIVTAVGVVAAAFFTSLGSTISAYITSRGSNKGNDRINVIVVPPAQVTEVPKLKEETGADEIETLRDISMWDLRGWKSVPTEGENSRYSPANYVNYLHVRKVRPASIYRAHYATNGSLIDLRCITHQYNLLLQQGGAGGYAHPGEKTYEMDIDVTNVAVGEEFLIVVEATYWNSFQGTQRQEIETYTDKDMKHMDELAIFVLMPESKPFRNPLRCARTADKECVSYGGHERFYTDKDGRFMYWGIDERLPDRHYQLSWDW